MRFNLFFKLFLAILTTSILVVLAMGFAVRWSFDRGFINYIHEREQQRIESLSNLLLEDYVDMGSNWAFIQDNRSRWWRSLRATTEPQSYDDIRSKHRSVPLPRTALLNEEGKIIAGGLPKHQNDLQHYPLIIQGKTVATLVAPTPKTRFLDANAEQRFQSQQLSATWSIVALCVLLAALVSYALARRLLLPIRRIGHATHQLAEGDYTTRILTHNRDELGQLAADFNALASALEIQEKLRMALVADISHELRTPLAILQGEIEALFDGLRQPTPETLQSLKQEVVHLNQLINDLYMLSLADAGALTYDFDDSVDLCAIVQRCCSTLQERLNAAGITAKIQCAQIPLIRADKLRLNQVFTNILENSLRYTDAPGQILIDVSHDSKQICVNVDDSSPGVAAADRLRIFERLYRVDASRNRAHGGAGLGLALCQRIIHAHGGNIEAHPSRLGGLQLRIYLPLLTQS